MHSFFQQLNAFFGQALYRLKREPRTLLASFVALVLIVAAVMIFVQKEEQKAIITIAPISVEVASVIQQTIPVNINALGSLTADQKVDISPELKGQISKIDFHNGQEVKVGKILFQLDDAIAREQLLAAEARLRLSKEDYKRKSHLLKQHALSQKAVDEAKEKLAEDESAVRQKKVLVYKMQLDAPFAGTLGSKTVSLGQYVAVGQTLVTLVNTKELKVIYHVSENYLSQLKIGQTVEVSSDALPGEQFSGTVSYISPSIDVATRTVEVHATVPNNAQQLAPGMFVKVTQELGERDNALVVPAQALVATVSGSNIYVVTKGHAQVRPVKVGIRWDNLVEITSGLSLDDKIIIAGQQKLRDGSAIQILDSKEKA